MKRLPMVLTITAMMVAAVMVTTALPAVAQSVFPSGGAYHDQTIDPQTGQVGWTIDCGDWQYNGWNYNTDQPEYVQTCNVSYPELGESYSTQNVW